MNVAAVLAELHSRLVRVYELLEDGDLALAADLVHDLAVDLARWRDELERSTRA